MSILDAYGFLVNLLLGAILVGFLPNFSNRVASMITQSPVRTAASGAAVLLAAPVVFLVLGLSLFGLPIALAGVVLYVVVGWVGTAYGRFALGTWLFVLAARGLALADVETEPVRNRWARLFVGYLAVALLIRIPYLGVAVDTVVVALGIGALATLVFEGYVRNERSPATAGDAGSEPAD